MRIASLLPSATEMVYELGLGEQLVGVTFECDYPAVARARAAIVVGGLETADMSPGEIDDLVHAKVEAGENLYDLDLPRLRAADPDVVITQDLCRVCAVQSGQVDEAMTALGCAAKVVTLDPHRLVDVLDSIGTLADALGVSAAGAALRAELDARLERVGSGVAGRSRERVFVLEWSDPPFSSGHWVPELVTAAGGQPVLADPGERSRAVDWAAIAEADPEVIIVAPCGFGLAGAAEQARQVLDRLPPDVPVWAVDGNSYVVRPGPRLVDGIELFASILHPSVFGAAAADRAEQVR